MNTFVLGALALTAASTPALAGSDPWSGADRSLESLASRLAPAQETSGVAITGFLRSSYINSGDVAVAPVGNDLGGFSIDDARLIMSANVANFSILLEADGSTKSDFGTGVLGQTGSTTALTLLDAYAAWNITDELRVQLGSFRAPFLASSLRGKNNLLFMDRSILGTAWTGRDEGVQLSGNWGMWGAMVAVQNGIDSAGDDLAISGRIQVTPMGQFASHEGALGATGDPSLMIGAAYYQDDGTFDDVIAFGVDAAFSVGIFGASAEMVDYDEGWAAAPPTATGTIGSAGVVFDDATPWNVAASVVAIPDRLEVGVRWEDFDDTNDSTAITVGANYYLQGHAAKWQAQYSTIDSDLNVLEIDVFQVGLTVSI
jgi:hypothetical protein